LHVPFSSQFLLYPSTPATKKEDSWENESGWESESELNISFSKSESDSNMSWSSSSQQQQQQQLKPLVQNEISAQPTSQKPPAGINITPSTLRKTNLLGADTVHELKPLSHISKKKPLENDDIFAAMGLSADTATSNVRSTTGQSTKNDSKKSTFGWQSAVLNNPRNNNAVQNRGVSAPPPSENQIKSSWDDADDELAALLDDD